MRIYDWLIKAEREGILYPLLEAGVIPHSIHSYMLRYEKYLDFCNQYKKSTAIALTADRYKVSDQTIYTCIKTMEFIIPPKKPFKVVEVF